MGSMGGRRLARGLAAGAAIAVVFAVAGMAAVPGAESDVRLLARQMEATHPDLFDSVPRGRFKTAVEALAGRADSLSENELFVELMRLAALPGNGNGHSGVFPGDPGHRREVHFYPLRLYTFRDATYVVDEQRKDGLVGARLTAVGGVPYAEVAKRVRPLVPHDNPSSLKGLLPHYLLSAEVLDGLGISDGVGPLDFTFTQGGRSRTVTLSPISASSYVSTFADPHYGHYPSLLPRRSPTPMYLKRLAADQWIGTIDRGRAVFVGYNIVQSPSFDLESRLASLARRKGVERVIVDLRLNGGGDNQTYGSLLATLQSSTINRHGRLFVLIGRATFSAAANFAADVDRSTKAIFVGEPTGGGVEIYGDAVSVLLPKSGVNARIATRYWNFGKGPRDHRLAIAPDIAVAPSIADFLAGRTRSSQQRWLRESANSGRFLRGTPCNERRGFVMSFLRRARSVSRSKFHPAVVREAIPSGSAQRKVTWWGRRKRHRLGEFFWSKPAGNRLLLGCQAFASMNASTRDQASADASANSSYFRSKKLCGAPSYVTSSCSTPASVSARSKAALSSAEM